MPVRFSPEFAIGIHNHPLHVILVLPEKIRELFTASVLNNVTAICPIKGYVFLIAFHPGMVEALKVSMGMLIKYN